MLEIITDPRFTEKMNSYPNAVRIRLLHLRKLIHEVADQEESITALEETLKWGEPSFLVKKGSTLRMDWKEKNPEHYAMYFKCTSKLVETFKKVYGTLFTYETHRAISFSLTEEVPEAELKECIKATLLYHTVKDRPSLGIQKLNSKT